MAILPVTAFSTVAVTLASGDALVVSQTGSLFLEGADAVTGTGTVSAFVYGSITSAEADAIDLNNAATVEIAVGAGGTVASMGNNAVEVQSTLLRLHNAGTLQAVDFGIDFLANAAITEVEILNSGSIIGKVLATQVTGIFNLVNSGTIITTGTVIQTDGQADVTITNTGTITGNGGSAMTLEGDVLAVTNTGLIRGGITFSGTSADFTNSGTVIGGVIGTSGDDNFYVREGTITGALSGGTGDDTYVIGSSDVVIFEATPPVDASQDYVYSTASYRLSNGLENLVLEGDAAITGSGNSRANGIIGSTADNRLLGRDGDDTLNGLEGNDLLRGGGGNDSLIDTLDGDCTLNGGDGFDFLSFFSTAPVVVDLAAGTATGSQSGTDVLSAIEGLITGIGNDTLSGSNAAEHFLSGSGDDRVSGGGGVDTLVGGQGRDSMSGGGQNDVFVFGSTLDSTAGAGLRDVITDFRVNGEVIDLSSLDAAAGGANDAFTFVGTATLAGSTGRLRFEQIVADNITVVEGDVTGDGLADFQIELTGLLALTVANFSL